MKKLKNLAFLTVVIFAGAMAQSCSDDVAQFLGIKVDATVNNVNASNLSNSLTGACEGSCDGDPDNDTMIKSWSVSGDSSATLTIDGHECNYNPGMMVDADAIQAGVIAAVNGEDSDCGPDNTHTEASAGSVLVEGLFGAWSFTTTHAGGLEGPTTIQDPGQDAFALAYLLRYFGVSYLSSVVPNVAAQAAMEDTWPDAGPYAYFATETVNCNNDGMMDDGDDSNGTVTVTASIRGEVLAEMASVKDIPSQETPSNATITDIVYIVTYNSCDVIGDFWGGVEDETVTLNGTTTTRVKYDPALQGTQQANSAQETADFSGTVFASNGTDTGVMVINARDVGIDDGGAQDGGFCMNGGAVIFGDVDEDGLDDSCQSNGTFIPYSFMYGIPDLGP